MGRECGKGIMSVGILAGNRGKSYDSWITNLGRHHGGIGTKGKLPPNMPLWHIDCFFKSY